MASFKFDTSPRGLGKRRGAKNLLDGKAIALAERSRLHGNDVMSDDDAGEVGAQAVARYLADMTRQLESMARASKLELLAYLLSMARAEAESLSTDTRTDNKPDRY